MRPLARVAYQSAVELMPRRLLRPPVEAEDLAVGAHEPDRLPEARQLVEGPLAPHDGGGRHEVGLDAAGAGGRDQDPVGLDAVPGPRIDDVVDVAVARPPGPDRGGRAGQAALRDRHHLVDAARPGSTTRGRCRSAHPPAGGGPATATSPPRLTRVPVPSRRGDAGGGPVGRQRLGGRAEVETDTARDADGAMARIELHVLVAGHRTQRLRAERAGGTAPRPGRRRSRARRWRCRWWGRRRLPSARPSSHADRERLEEQLARRSRSGRRWRAPPAAPSRRGTGCRRDRWRRARPPAGARRRRRQRAPARRRWRWCRWPGTSGSSAPARSTSALCVIDEVPPDVTMGDEELAVGAEEDDEVAEWFRCCPALPSSCRSRRRCRVDGARR